MKTTTDKGKDTLVSGKSTRKPKLTKEDQRRARSIIRSMKLAAAEARA